MIKYLIKDVHSTWKLNMDNDRQARNCGRQKLNVGETEKDTKRDKIRNKDDKRANIIKQ